MKRSIVTMLLAAMTIVLATLTIHADEKSASKAPPFKPVAKVHDLMRLNKQLFKSLQANLQGGSPNWEDAVHEASLMAEIGNVLQYHQPTSETDWWQFAGVYRDGAKRLIAATEAKDAKTAIGTHAALFASCKQCHKKYREE